MGPKECFDLIRSRCIYRSALGRRLDLGNRTTAVFCDWALSLKVPGTRRNNPDLGSWQLTSGNVPLTLYEHEMPCGISTAVTVFLAMEFEISRFAELMST